MPRAVHNQQSAPGGAQLQPQPPLKPRGPLPLPLLAIGARLLPERHLLRLPALLRPRPPCPHCFCCCWLLYRQQRSLPPSPHLHPLLRRLPLLLLLLLLLLLAAAAAAPLPLPPLLLRQQLCWTPLHHCLLRLLLLPLLLHLLPLLLHLLLLMRHH